MAVLRYLNKGERAYWHKPVDVATRKNWEYQAVVQGRCAPRMGSGQRPGNLPTVQSARLWVFPPETAHGWTGPVGETCHIVVMHFSHAPDAVRQAVADRGMLDAPLTPADLRRIDELHDAVAPEFRRLNSHSEVVFDHALLELSLMALRTVPASPLTGAETYAKRKVEQAMAWYAEHLASGPSVTAMARAVYVSPPHLRRLFRDATGRSPHAAIQRVRLDRAKQMMAGTDLPLKEIASACGFTSPTVFSRAFARVEGLCPRSWRDRSKP